MTLPAGSLLYQDTGFQGYALAGTTIFQPKKKPRGGELTTDEKTQNRAISSIRSGWNTPSTASNAIGL